MLKNSFNFSLNDNLTNTIIDLSFDDSTCILSSKFLFNNNDVLTKVKFQMKEFNFGKDIEYFYNSLYSNYKYTRINKICDITLDNKTNKYIYTLRSNMIPVFTEKQGIFQTDICYLNKYNGNEKKPKIEYIKNSRIFFNKLLRIINNSSVKFKSKTEALQFVDNLRIYFKVNIKKQQVHNKVKISRTINEYMKNIKHIQDLSMFSENLKNYELFNTADIDIGNIHIEQIKEPLQILRDCFDIQYSNVISEYRKDGNHWTITFKSLKDNEREIVRNIFRLFKIIIDPSCTFYNTSKNITGLSCSSYMTEDINNIIKKSKFNHELRNSQQLINIKLINVKPLRIHSESIPPEGRNKIINDNINALNKLIEKKNKIDLSCLTSLINKKVNEICDERYLIKNLDLIENHNSEKEKFYKLYFGEIKEFITKTDYTLGIFVKNKKLIKNRIFDSLETKWKMTEEEMNKKRKNNKSKEYYKKIIGNKYRYQRKENKLINKFKKDNFCKNENKMLNELNLIDYHLVKKQKFKFSNINDIRQKDKSNREKLIISDIISNENILSLCNSQKRRLLKEFKKSLNYKSTKKGIRNFLNESFDRLCNNGLDKEFGILKSNLYKYKKYILNWLIIFIETCYKNLRVKSNNLKLLYNYLNHNYVNFSYNHYGGILRN